MITTNFKDQHNDQIDNNTSQKYNSSEQKESSQNEYLNSVKRKHFIYNPNSMSPLEKDIIEYKDFSTPIQIAQFSQNKKDRPEQLNQQSSPLMLIQLSGDIRKIAEKDNQSSGDDDYYQESHEIYVQTVMDLMGNKICEFNVGNNPGDDQYERQLSPIQEDKQNEITKKYLNLNTPLKIRPLEARSPLQDITPSMTQKKKGDPMNTKTNKKNKTSNKTSNKTLGLGFELQKWGLLTPRTMAQSRMNKTKNSSGLNSSALRRVERF